MRVDQSGSGIESAPSKSRPPLFPTEKAVVSGKWLVAVNSQICHSDKSTQQDSEEYTALSRGIERLLTLFKLSQSLWQPK